jgi:Phosphodiester glycosidase
VHRSVTGSGPDTGRPDYDPGRPGRRPGRGIRWRPGRARSRRNAPGRRRLRDRLWVRITAAALTAFLLVVAWSVGNALTTPGGGSISTRLAEWARDHYLGPVVTFGEWLTYNPPKKGGKPSFSLAGPATPATRPTGRPQPSATPPPPLKSFAGKPLPGEGQWRVLGTVHGVPAIYGTYLRASRIYSSYVAGVASMNQSLLKFQLRPGTEDPGPGHWKAPSWIPPGTRRGLEATFNSGFKIDVSGGGFYLNGVTRGNLAKGAASEVYYRNGHLAIGVWGQNLHMTSDVVGVRQNLRPIVENGKVPGSVDNNVLTQWGATLGGGYYVWRSGIGITKDGRVLFVYGPALNVRELADLLKRAGAVTAMQLDINPEWMSFMTYRAGHHPNNPTPKNLLPDQQSPPNRYYSLNGRDFTAVYAR